MEKDRTGRVLEVSGARQVGKTYILKKFARENFACAIYINMAELTGERFLKCLEQAEYWEPGMPVDENSLHKAVTLIKEKQGSGDLVEELSKIVYKEESGRFTKRMVHWAIGWLHASHIIGYAGKSINCDYLNIKENARFYFMDIGLARYFLTRAGAAEGVVKGIVAENFVYLALARRIPRKIAGTSPWFGSYEKIMEN